MVCVVPRVMLDRLDPLDRLDLRVAYPDRLEAWGPLDQGEQ